MADDALTAAVTEVLAAHASHGGGSGNGAWNADCLAVDCSWSAHGTEGGLAAAMQAHQAHVAELVAQIVREHTAAKQAEAWDEAIRAVARRMEDGEPSYAAALAYEMTQNPHRAERLHPEPAPDGGDQ